MIPRIFEGQSCVICAGGPSLCGFDFDRLEGLNVIAINRALEVVPNARVLWWSDARFWRRNRERILAHAATYKMTGDIDYTAADELNPQVLVYHFSGKNGFDPDPNNIRHGNNSAYAAMHLATHLGARLIVLLGVDMRHGEGGRTHFHDGHGLLHEETTLTRVMLPYFETLSEPLRQRGIRVLNASPDSRLAIWPRCTIDEGLAAARAPCYAAAPCGERELVCC